MSAADAPTFVDFVPLTAATTGETYYVNPDHVVTIRGRTLGEADESIIHLAHFGTFIAQGMPAEVAARLRGEAL